MRALYPVANGLLSYINPFCILFLNKDLARQVIRSMTCHKYKVVILLLSIEIYKKNFQSEAQVSGIASTSTKHQGSHRKGLIGSRKREEPKESNQVLF